MNKSFVKLCSLVLPIVLIAFSTFGDGWLNLGPNFGQQNDPDAARKRKEYLEALNQAYDERAERDAERRAQLRDLVAMVWAKTNQIQATLEKTGPDAYRKYSDGTVASLKLILYVLGGLAPDNDPRCRYLSELILIENYEVKEAAAEGCRIRPLNATAVPDQEQDSFVTGLKLSGDVPPPNILMVRKIGICSYTTAEGARRKILTYDFGERATKEEYESFFKKL